MFTHSGSALAITDTKSTNGTFVNGKKIVAPQVVLDTDKIYIGDFVITLQLLGARCRLLPFLRLLLLVQPAPHRSALHGALAVLHGSKVYGRVLSPLEPAIGSTVIFSSGWENMHYVEPLAGGTRLAVPIFFVTREEYEERGAAYFADLYL